MSETAVWPDGDVSLGIDAALRAIAADLERVLEEISRLAPAQIALVEDAVARVELQAASLRPRLDWIRWRTGQSFTRSRS